MKSDLTQSFGVIIRPSSPWVGLIDCDLVWNFAMHCSLLRDQNSHSQNRGNSEDMRALKSRTIMFFSFGNEMVVYINSDISIAKKKKYR